MKISFSAIEQYRPIKQLGGCPSSLCIGERNMCGVTDRVFFRNYLKSRDEWIIDKLYQQARILVPLRHDNIATCYGVREFPWKNYTWRTDTKQMHSTDDTLFWFVWEYISGVDLYSFLIYHLRSGLLIPLPIVVCILKQIAMGLAYAHQYTIHHDISLENFIINKQGFCKIMEFGMGDVMAKQPDHWTGKLMYMSPEQICNDPVDERSDIFSLGLVAYQLLTGVPILYAAPRLSFEDQAHKIYQQMKIIPPPHQMERNIPEELSMMVKKMLGYRPEYRYQRAIKIVEELERKYPELCIGAHSLAAYINCSPNFAKCNTQQNPSLDFLDTHTRELDAENYTALGKKFISERKYSLFFRMLCEKHNIRS
ncbi:serine/threonine protein kinase [Candidatus Uabimicrobium amorphum]|uniref:Protein kinase n=1 Tax=Uabimicrobium amorphum TaxID=2596890 RepID=A0A5S9F7F9_UABAM|nr:serine/threonine-protein kinase [Candidatus Uabimicrobium amorphum]BBM87604.1 protein kinase [Candidatus Uabimicrobium amorphum]